MLKRLTLAALAAVLLSTSSGCCVWQTICCVHNRNLWRHWCGPQCGEVYWSEWFNDPPNCCDPCNACGHFVGNREHLRGGPNGGYGGYGGPGAGYAEGETYDEPTMSQGPTPAQEPETVVPEEAKAKPKPRPAPPVPLICQFR